MLTKKVRICSFPTTGMLYHCSCGDVAAVQKELVLALDDAKALHAVAEERGHRDAVVVDLDVAEVVADGLVVVERLERHTRAAERVP